MVAIIKYAHTHTHTHTQTHTHILKNKMKSIINEKKMFLVRKAGTNFCFQIYDDFFLKQ